MNGRSSSLPRLIDSRRVEMRRGWSSVVLGGRQRRELRIRQLALVGDTVSYFLIVSAVWAIYTTTGMRYLPRLKKDDALSPYALQATTCSYS